MWIVQLAMRRPYTFVVLVNIFILESIPVLRPS